MLFSELLLISLQYYNTLEGSIKFIKYMKKISEFILILLEQEHMHLGYCLAKHWKLQTRAWHQKHYGCRPLLCNLTGLKLGFFINTVVRAEQGGGNFS